MTERAAYRVLSLAAWSLIVMAAGVSGGWLLASPEKQLARSYGQAFADAQMVWDDRARETGWLRQASAGGEGFALTHPLKIGDRLAITVRDGETDTLEVVAVTVMDGDVIGLPGTRFQLITGRFAGTETAPLARLLYAVDPAPAPQSASKVDKVL